MAQLLEIDNVSKTFGTGSASVCALTGIDFSVQPGEFLSIVGPSGCGKSTLLRLMAGLDTASSGAIRLAGRPVSPSDRRCAVMFQEPRLFPWKRVKANVEVGGRRSTTRVDSERWLDQVGLTGFADRYPHQLSGGMAQRVALARALSGQPELLLLDEPFGALDALTRMQMQDLLQEVCQGSGASVVMVTHDIDEALYLGDRVVVMSSRPGRIIDQVTVARHRRHDRSDLAVAAQRSHILRHFGFDESCTGSGAVSASAAD